MTRLTSRREATQALRHEALDAPPSLACEIAWTISARALGDHAGRGGDAELVWLLGPVPRVEIRVGGRVIESDRLPGVGLHLDVQRDADFAHARVMDESGVCWLDATIRLDDSPGLLFARTRTFETLGLAGGRYSAPELWVR